MRRCSSACKCIIFLFADWDVSDCFSGKVDATNMLKIGMSNVIKSFVKNGMASAFPLKQLLRFSGK